MRPVLSARSVRDDDIIHACKSGKVWPGAILAPHVVPDRDRDYGEPAFARHQQLDNNAVQDMVQGRRGEGFFFAFNG